VSHWCVSIKVLLALGSWRSQTETLAPHRVTPRMLCHSWNKNKKNISKRGKSAHIQKLRLLYTRNIMQAVNTEVKCERLSAHRLTGGVTDTWKEVKTWSVLLLKEIFYTSLQSTSFRFVLVYSRLAAVGNICATAKKMFVWRESRDGAVASAWNRFVLHSNFYMF